MIAKLKFILFRFLTGISFRILLFNALLIFFAISSILLINDHERYMLRELEVSLNEQARFLANGLAWRVDYKESSIRSYLKSQPWTYQNYIQVFDTKGNLVFQTNMENWDTGPDPGEIGHKIAYKAISTTWGILTGSVKQVTNRQELLHYQNQDLESALGGKPSTRIIRNGYEKAQVVLVSTFPIRKRKINIGAIRIHRSANRVLVAVYKFRWDTLNIIFISVLGALILNTVLVRTILGPIKHLTNNAVTLLPLKEKKSSDSLKLFSGYDEIVKLSTALSQLTNQLADEVFQHRHFIDDLVHELKNPLASIRSAAEAANLAEQEADKKRFQNMMNADISRMERLLSNVKDLSHIRLDSTEDQPGQIDIIKLTSSYVENMRSLNSARLEFIAQAEFKAMVKIEEDRYIQLLDNLVRNALTFSPPSEEVILEIRQTGEYALINIKDRGTGILPENMDKIFKRFVSIRNDDQHKEHSGLGLAIAKSIAENSGGNIKAVNRSAGGTCFQVQLPLSE